jgi:hypothetical protein
MSSIENADQQKNPINPINTTKSTDSVEDYFLLSEDIKSLDESILAIPNPFKSHPLFKKIETNLLNSNFSFGDFGLVYEFTKDEMEYIETMAKRKLANKRIYNETEINNSTKGFLGEFASMKLFRNISKAIDVSGEEFDKIIPRIYVTKNDGGQDFRVGKATYSIKSRKDGEFVRGTRSDKAKDLFCIGVYTVLWSFVGGNLYKYKLAKVGDESNNIFPNFEGLKHLVEHFIEHMTFAVEKIRNENPQT